MFQILSTAQILAQIKSQEFVIHINQHFITTSPLTHVTNSIQDFVKCCIRSWVHLTFDLTACYLVDYNQNRLNIVY